MTDKELRRLGRRDLIEIIYELQKRIVLMEKELSERKILIEEAGSIAEAAISINRVFEAAQAAADQYLQSVYAAGSDENVKNRKKNQINSMGDKNDYAQKKKKAYSNSDS